MRQKKAKKKRDRRLRRPIYIESLLCSHQKPPDDTLNQKRSPTAGCYTTLFSSVCGPVFVILYLAFAWFLILFCFFFFFFSFFLYFFSYWKSSETAALAFVSISVKEHSTRFRMQRSAIKHFSSRALPFLFLDMVRKKIYRKETVKECVRKLSPSLPPRKKIRMDGYIYCAPQTRKSMHQS